MAPMTKEKLLAKARSTHRKHSLGYATTWGSEKNIAAWAERGHHYTGDLAKDCGCTVEQLARDFEDPNCPICHRSYASMAEAAKAAGKHPRTHDPLFHMHWHIAVPLWIVVCPSCHPRIERLPLDEWFTLPQAH
jgi:hypothetical protein